MRSLLFVPADSERKLAKAPGCGADAIVLDLEDAVAAESKEAARKGAVDFLAARSPKGPSIQVRINGLQSDHIDADLDAIVPAKPDVIMLPKATSGNDVALLSAMIAAREATAGIDDGTIRISAMATESPGATLRLANYRGASARLAAIAWSSEDLMAALGAEASTDANGLLTDPFRLARTLCLFAAADCNVAAIDRVFPNFQDAAALEAEALSARRDGFAAKLAIHPDQVVVINRVFTPTVEAIARARAVISAFDAAPGSGVVGLDGEMLDLPHLVRARMVLTHAADAGLIRR